jgi:hypothetical protein
MIYTGRPKTQGADTHLLIGNERTRRSLCGIIVPTQRTSWTWTPLAMKKGGDRNSPVAPFMPVTCKRCVLVLMGRAWEAWDWTVLENP